MMYKLETMSASEVGRLVNSRKISPVEVVKYFEKRILERNPSINAFVYTKFEEALEVAKREEKLLNEGKTLGPFAGCVFGLKDFLPNKIGWTTSCGGVKCLISTDEVNSVFCEAMEEAGAIAIGKTNAPSYGFRGTTDNALYGVTRTPFNLEYNSGGSSGGSASAVADGLVLISEGGDAGGSIRIPAAFNNLYGFKAGLGTIPSVNRPDAYSASHPFCFGGGVTKTVEDAAILLNYMAKFNPLDPYCQKREINYLEEMNKPVKYAKIAYTVDFDIFSVEEEVKIHFLKEIQKFEDLGFKIEPVHFNFKYSAFEFSEIWCKGITIDPTLELNLLKEEGKDYLKTNKEDFPEEFIYWKEKCEKLGINDLYAFNLARTNILDEFEKVFKDYDFIISPVTCVAGILNQEKNTKGPSEINGIKVDPLIGWTETFLVNFVGYPAASIPSGLTKNNVPFGLHLISKMHDEGQLLSLSHAFEEKFPWKENYKIALNRKIIK